MASSNRHWPSLFKSKPCNTHHQWQQHDINSSSLLSQRPPYTSVPGAEERSPEPKPRWNPKPEQIRILEAIFNSGMVNPPRDEIRKIRVQLQEYGQVGDANVFYWFQNRKSRSKHKQRHLQAATRPQSRSATNTPSAGVGKMSVATSSSSSSSERSSGSSIIKTVLSSGTIGGVASMVDVSNPPTAPGNQTSIFQQTTHGEFSGEPIFFQGPPQDYCFSAVMDLSSLSGAVPEQGLGLCSGLFTDMMMNQLDGCKGVEEEARMKAHLHHCYGTLAYDTATTANTVADAAAATATTSATTNGASTTVSTIVGPIDGIIQGIGTGAGGASRSTVFINEVAFEVGAGPLNVREAFGEEAVLLHSSGHPVLVDEWGVTLHPLQHGASYYLV